jgi:RNA polymerase sigma factor (sigma-70 family)
MIDSSQQSSVTEWVLAETQGFDASRKLWERYLSEVVRACEARLTPNQRRSISAEDLAQEVFRDFFLGLRSQGFKRLRDREDVRQILAMLVERISIDQWRRHAAVHAGSGEVRLFSELESACAIESGHSFDNLVARPTAPSDEAELRQLLLTLVPDLTDPEMQDIACDRIMGFSIEEIARERSLTEHRVSRKLRFLILKLRASTQRDA